MPVSSLPPGTIYRAIDTAATYLAGGVATVDACVAWLRENDLGLPTPDSPRDPAPPEDHPAVGAALMGAPTHRAARHTAAEIRALTSAHKQRGPTTADADRLLADHRHGRGEILKLDIHPVPADAIACYWPLHLDPERWGIYISVQDLLEHTLLLTEVFGRRLLVLEKLEAIAACVLFEVFHHEFFHHIVESTATTLEILSASFGDQPRPIYRNYRDATHRRLGSHPHEPLEEALANAYAHNSFSFLSRSRLGFRTVQAQRYQDVMRRAWQLSSKGYRHAAHYAIGRDADSGYVSGGAQLLAMLLASDKLDPGALLLVAQRVMPRGHTALVEKADVPTFLVGGPEQIDRWLDLVPAPNETYTGLFLPWDTSELDAALRARHKATTRREPGASEPRS